MPPELFQLLLTVMGVVSTAFLGLIAHSFKRVQADIQGLQKEFQSLQLLLAEDFLRRKEFEAERLVFKEYRHDIADLLQKYEGRILKLEWRFPEQKSSG